MKVLIECPKCGYVFQKNLKYLYYKKICPHCNEAIEVHPKVVVEVL